MSLPFERRPKIIITLKYYLYRTRRGLPIFYNFPLLVGYLPSSWSEFAKIMKKARWIAERKLYHRLGRRVKGNLEFYVLKVSRHKGKVSRGTFVSIFPSIIVDGFGNIVKVKAPRKEHREAYRLYVDYLRDMYVKTGDKKWWYKYLGVSTDPNWPLTRFKFSRRVEEAQVKTSGFLTVFDPPDKVLGRPFWLERVLDGAGTPPELRSWLDDVLEERGGEGGGGG